MALLSSTPGEGDLVPSLPFVRRDTGDEGFWLGGSHDRAPAVDVLGSLAGMESGELLDLRCRRTERTEVNTFLQVDTELCDVCQTPPHLSARWRR